MYYHKSLDTYTLRIKSPRFMTGFNNDKSPVSMVEASKIVTFIINYLFVT